MTVLRSWLAPALVAIAAPATAAPDAPPVWQGVWQGTVGSLPVRVCLARRSDTYSVGAYYYLSRLLAIRLSQQDGSRVWLEGEDISNGPARPRWQFETVAPARLTGRWSDGGRQLAFRLTRVATARDVEPCGSAAFNGPRLRPLRVTAARARHDRVGYTKLSFDPGPAFESVELQSFALDGILPATRRINARLRRLMPMQPARGEWFACVAGALDQRGSDGDYAATIEPTLITPRWLAAAESVGGDCGGAHPSSGVASLTFDRATGAEIDLHGWLTAAVVERQRLQGIGHPVFTVRPVLRQLVLRHAGAIDPDCRTAVAEAEFWDIGLARPGLRLTPRLAHVEQGCEAATLVPWRVLTLYLNAEGRAGMMSLR